MQNKLNFNFMTDLDFFIFYPPTWKAQYVLQLPVFGLELTFLATLESIKQ